MKRIFGAVAVLVLAILLVPLQNVAAQNTNDFTITSYDIHYELSADAEGRSVLKTTETIVADFPTTNQNHGIERAIPARYDGHPTSLSITNVTNGQGGVVNYSTYDSNGNTVVRVGDADTYVHGEQTYQLAYTQRDVTKFYQDTNKDEWYWDTNGLEWKVPIETLTVTATIDQSLANTLIGAPSCYQGEQGSTSTCSITTMGEGSYMLTATNLSASENVTIVFGFQPNTFAGYTRTLLETITLIWGIIQGITVPIAFGLIIAFLIIYSRKKFRSAEENPIAVEYIPSREASVLVSSQLLTAPQATFSAQLIDLAVRHFISIVQTKEKVGWKLAEYDIVIAKDLSTLKEEEKEIIIDMFSSAPGTLPAVGDRLALATLKNNMSYRAKTLDDDKKLKKLIEGTYGLREKSPQASRLFYIWAIVICIVAILSLSIALGVVAIIIALLGWSLRPLTDKGLLLRRYLLGLDKYIKASEVERLKFLQGPDTAQKVGYALDPNDKGQLVKLYERVLPYAMLFGYEKEWAKHMGDFYQQAQTSPDWYTGSSVFNAALFASSLQTFSQTTSYTSYASSANSSTGGSGGGGSSGGGGGGGGGGGW